MTDAPQHWRKAVIGGVHCLVPDDEQTDAWFRKIKAGAVVAMAVDFFRNAQRSKLYWKVCSLVAENHEELNDRVKVSDTLKQLAGLVNVWRVTLPSGEKLFYAKPRSIAFANMRENDFQDFMETAFRLIETELWPGVDLEFLRQEAREKSGGDNVSPPSRKAS